MRQRRDREAYKGLGAALRKERQRKCLSQLALGLRVGVTGAAICNFETGRCLPEEQTLRRLHAALPGAHLDRWLAKMDAERAPERVRVWRKDQEAAKKKEPEAAPEEPKAAKARPKAAAPRRKYEVKPRGRLADMSITEVCRAAKAAGMTYGEYVARRD